MTEISKLYGIAEDEIGKILDAGLGTIEEFYDAAKHPTSREALSESTGIDTFRLEELSSVAGNFILMMDCSWDEEDE